MADARQADGSGHGMVAELCHRRATEPSLRDLLSAIAALSAVTRTSQWGVLCDETDLACEYSDDYMEHWYVCIVAKLKGSSIAAIVVEERNR